MVQTLTVLIYKMCAELPFKRLRGEEDFGCTTTEELMETESGLFGRRAPPQRKTEPPGFRKNQQGMPEASREPQDVSKEQRKDENSVFVSNLAFNLEDPEVKLRTLFGGCGTIQQVRLVYTPKGVFRGYCYVQFEDKLAVPEALKLDRQEVDGRPMYVSPCVDKNKNPDFKVSRMYTTKFLTWYLGFPCRPCVQVNNYYISFGECYLAFLKSFL